MSRAGLLALLALALVPAPPAAGQAVSSAGAAAVPEVPTRAALEAAATITEADVLRRIGVLAHDSMRGRDTPGPELERTAEWAASELARFGLRGGAGGPGGSGADDGVAGERFLQRYPIESVRTVADGSEIVVEGDGSRLVFGEDFISGYGVLPEVERSGGVVLLLSAGGAAPDLDRVELEGRHVVMSAGAPDAEPLLSAVFERGPQSILLLANLPGPEWERRAEMQAELVQARLGGVEPAGPVVLLVRQERLLPLLRERGADPAEADAPAALEVPDLRMTFRGRSRVLERRSAPNVVAVLPGSDPELRDEYVLFSAHMDHVGVGRPDPSGDSIYNGADDNASGTSVVLEVAEAFAALPEAPARSLAFVLVSGEEKGLWGSRYFSEHPTLPLERAVAALNLDMVGRNWSDTIVAIGREHSELGAILGQVNARHPELGMTAIDDLWPEERFYYRSDHYNFARKGVPILFFFNGVHDDYHRPGDHVERIDAEKAARIGRLVFHLGLEIAERPEAPAWDPESREAIVEPGW